MTVVEAWVLGQVTMRAGELARNSGKDLATHWEEASAALRSAIVRGVEIPPLPAALAEPYIEAAALRPELYLAHASS